MARRQSLALLSLFSFIFCCFAADSRAQLARGLLVEGDPFPDGGPAHVVEEFGKTTVNEVKGYAVVVQSTDGIADVSHVWGHHKGQAGVTLRTEAVVGAYDQISFHDGIGIDDAGQIAYRALCTQWPAGKWRIVYLDALELAMESGTNPHTPGVSWGIPEDPGITGNGIVYWISGMGSSLSPSGEGLFTQNGVLLKTMDSLPGISGLLLTDAFDDCVRFSAAGTHWITTVNTTGPSSKNHYLVIDGAAVPTPSGALIGEGISIAPELGGLPAEQWSTFRYVDIIENGSYILTGSTSAASDVNGFLALDGKIIHREGDWLDGVQLQHAPLGTTLNENGDVAQIWQVDDPSSGGDDLEALFFNGRLMALEGDSVDLDGDGVKDLHTTLMRFVGENGLSIGPNRKLYFVAEIDVHGTPSTSFDDVDAFFWIRTSCGPVRRHGVGCPGTGGFVPNLEVTGCFRTTKNINLSITDALGGSMAMLQMGLTKDWVHIGAGCYLNIGATFPPPIFLPLAGSGPGDGAISAPATIPALSSVPVTIQLQAFVQDGASALGYVVTNALEMALLL